jgi:hypothetical protein
MWIEAMGTVIRARVVGLRALDIWPRAWIPGDTPCRADLYGVLKVLSVWKAL